MADWSRYAVGGAKRPDSFTGLTPNFSSALSNMLAAAEEELGQNSLSITSAYRSPEKQAELYKAALKKYGSVKAARRWVAPPGKSMHNKGLAVDFGAAGGGLLRDPNSPQAQWLKKNASRFGLAVPMSWEPWQVELAGARGKPNPNQAIASDTMRVLGKQPKGLLTEPQATNNTESNMTPEQAPKGLLGSLGIQKMVEGAEGDAGQRFYNRQSFGDTMAALAPALGRMGVMGLDVPAQAVADRRFAKRDQEQKTSKTIEALSRMNTPQAKAALEYLSAGGDPVAALKMAFGKPGDAPSAFQALAYQARAAGLEEGSPEYQEFMLSGGGAPATYRALKMQAEAAGFQEGTPEFQEFMATRGAGLQAGARQTATNVANVATGGDAAQAIAAGTETGKKVVQEGSELNEMQRNIQGLRVTIDQLSALSDAATYTALGQVGNEIRKQLGLDPSEGAVARTEYIAVVNNQILPLLKETFGAAFTAAEGDTLRATLGDPNKTPAEKKVVLNAFIAQKERDLAARQGGPTSSAPSATGGDDPLGLRD